MKYMLMVIGNEANWENQSPEEQAAAYAVMDEFNKELMAAGAFVSGAGLKPLAQARTIRFGGEGTAPVVTDGPFAEAKEQLAGYWVLECANDEEAFEWAKRAPIQDAAIEIRPLADDA